MTRLRRGLYKTAGYLALIAAWMIASLIIGPALPWPWETAMDGAALLVVPATWQQIGYTLVRIAIGFLIALVAGFIIGLARSRSKTVMMLTDPLVNFFQGVPPLLWVIPVFFIAGFGLLPPAVAIALIVLPLVIVNTGQAAGALPVDLVQMVQVFAPGRLVRLRELVIPHLAPALSASFSLGLGLAIKSSVLAEFFGAANGVGFMINAEFYAGQYRRLYAWGLVAILFIVCLDRLGRRLMAVLFPSRETRRRRILSRLLKSSGQDVEPPALRTRSGIVCQGMGFSYEDQRTAPPLLRKISFRLPRNGILVLSGDSGTGKSTLLKLLSGLLLPGAGIIRTDNSRISFMFQEDGLLPWRTALENAALPLARGGRRRAFSRAQVLLGLAGLADGLAFPDELSGGMRRRVALARCFSRPPSLLLLDEPFHGLHKNARRQLWRLLFRLHAQSPCPLVIVTHFPEEIPVRRGIRFRVLRGRPASLVSGRGRR